MVLNVKCVILLFGVIYCCYRRLLSLLTFRVFTVMLCEALNSLNSFEFVLNVSLFTFINLNETVSFLWKIIETNFTRIFPNTLGKQKLEQRTFRLKRERGFYVRFQ